MEQIFIENYLITQFFVRLSPHSLFFYLGFLLRTFTNQRRKGIPLTTFYHFHLLYSNLDISRPITSEISPLHIASSRTRSGKLWLPREKLLMHSSSPEVLYIKGVPKILVKSHDNNKFKFHWKEILLSRCFPVNFPRYLRTRTNISEQLLLKV